MRRELGCSFGPLRSIYEQVPTREFIKFSKVPPSESSITKEGPAASAPVASLFEALHQNPDTRCHYDVTTRGHSEKKLASEDTLSSKK